ncbi:MAG: calcium/sodium antiporter [Acidobacteriota bacterium]
MDTMTLVLFVLGLGLLIAGAEALVRGSSGLAGRFGIPPLVIGLTVVAFGTSSPEMTVSVLSALGGKADLALGNVVGSNVLNVLFILGLSALITPLVVARQLVILDVPVMIAVSLAVWGMAADGRISRLEGALLFAGALGYTAFLVRMARRERSGSVPGAEPEVPRDPLALQAVLVVAGLGLLVLGSRWLVDGAVAFARSFGLSELVIGLTIVAAGTSLPEVASSVVAALRGQRDIAVGNVVGSNLFNLLMVLGASALVAPGGVGVSDAALRFDLPVMVAVAAACLPIFFTGHLIARWEGGLFLFYYLAYTGFLVLDAQGHTAASGLGRIVLLYVLPITALTLVVLGARALRAARRDAPRA